MAIRSALVFVAGRIKEFVHGDIFKIGRASLDPSGPTVARTATLPDKSGTIAMTSDITGTNSGTNTGDETGARIATLLKAATNKTTIVDADEISGTEESGASFPLIRTTWTNVKVFLKTYFDTLYAAKNVTTRMCPEFANMPASLTGASIMSGNYTIASDYFCGSAVSLTGVRVHWNSGTEATIKVNVFLNGSTTAISTVTATFFGRSTLLFVSPVTIGAGDTVKLSMYAGASVYSWSTTGGNVPTAAMQAGPLMHTRIGWYNDGDAAPIASAGGSPGYYAPLHPLFN